jgi:hypothetical protein
VLRTATGIAEPGFVYTTAMQSADFGGARTELTFRVYQISAQVGRGFASEDKDDAASREVRSRIRSEAATADGATRTLTSSYLYYHDVFEEDPDAARPCTGAAVDAMEIGVETVT